MADVNVGTLMATPTLIPNAGDQKVCKKKNLSLVFGADRKIRSSGSLLGILRKASWCQTVTLGQVFVSAPHTHERFLYSFLQRVYISCDAMYRKLVLVPQLYEKRHCLMWEHRCWPTLPYPSIPHHTLPYLNLSHSILTHPNCLTLLRRVDYMTKTSYKIRLKRLRPKWPRAEMTQLMQWRHSITKAKIFIVKTSESELFTGVMSGWLGKFSSH